MMERSNQYPCLTAMSLEVDAFYESNVRIHNVYLKMIRKFKQHKTFLIEKSLLNLPTILINNLLLWNRKSAV